MFKIQKSILNIVLCLVLLLVTGCFREKELSNVVATVNGSPIYLHTVQLVQESGVSQLDTSRPLTLGRMRQQYSTVIAELIIYEVILQYLERTGMGITDRQVADYEKTFRENFSGNEFNIYFLEHAIDMEAWRELLRYHLAFQLFKKEVLFKNFTPSWDEVEGFYGRYKHNFVVSPRLSLYLAVSTSREPLKSMKTMQDLYGVHDESEAIHIYYADLKHDTIKSDWSKEWQKRLFALKDNMCTDIIEEDELFKRACLEAKIPEKRLATVEMYPYIEQLIKEERVWDLLEEWLWKEMETAQIRVSIHLLDDV